MLSRSDRFLCEFELIPKYMTQKSGSEVLICLIALFFPDWPSRVEFKDMIFRFGLIMKLNLMNYEYLAC
jgi:hypothetical protein